MAKSIFRTKWLKTQTHILKKENNKKLGIYSTLGKKIQYKVLSDGGEEMNELIQKIASAEVNYIIWIKSFLFFYFR